MSFVSKFLTMTGFFLALVLSFVLISPSRAQASEKAPSLYRVSRNGVESLLIGTVHIGVGLDDLKEKPEILEAIRNSKQIIIEWPFSETEVTQFLENVSEALISNPEISGIKAGDVGTLSPDEISRLVRIGVPEKVAVHLGEGHCKVLMFSSVLFPKPKSLDFEIAKKGYENKLPVIGLDSHELIEAANSAENLAAVKPAPKFSCSITEWLRNYSDSEFKEMGRKYATEPYLSGTIANAKYNPQVAFRNQAWMLKLNTLLKEKSTIAVGLGHIGGETGLIRLLEAEGFQVQKFQPAAP